MSPSFPQETLFSALGNLKIGRMLNTRIISGIFTLPIFLGFGQSALAQDALPGEANIQALNLAPSVNFAAGECALFVWTGHPLRLTFISQTKSGEVYSAQNGIKRFTGSAKAPPDKFGQSSNQNFRDDAALSLQLRLNSPSEFYKSIAYTSGTITFPGADGWLSVESAQAVSTCNETDGNKPIHSDPAGYGFTVPTWLETPTRLSMLHPPDPTPTAPDITPATQPLLEPETTSPEPEIFAVQHATPAAASAFIQTTQVDYRKEVDPQIKTVEIFETKPALTPVLNPAPITAPEPVLASIPDPIPAPIPAPIPDPIEDIPPGYMVQIGAFPNEAVARQKWDDAQQNLKYLKRRKSTVQVAAVEDVGVVYRLRVTGLPDKRRALQFCNRLKSDGIDCFVASR